MKNFISLSLIALIFMSGCKSSSFMTQRYTKLGHSPHKYAQAHIPTKKQNAEDKGILPGEDLAIHKTSDVQPVSASAVIKHDAGGPQGLALFKQVTAPALKAGNTAITLVKTEVKKSNEQKLKSKNTLKEKAQGVMGLFNTLFKIVLFAIILAVLVAVIIILLLT